MNRRRGQLQGYFAGIFDGEGHVGIHRQDGRSYQLKVCVQMDDPQAVLLLWKEYPEAVITYHMEKKFWKVALNQHKAKRFLEELIPYMIIKKEQAKIAHSFLVHRAREHTGKRSGGNYCEYCQRCLDNILRVRADNKRVNSVNAFLQYELREYRAKREDVEDDVKVINAKMAELLEGVETRDRTATSVEPISALEQEIVQ